MSESRESLQDFAAGWLRGQEAFWAHWGSGAVSDDAYEKAEAFWEHACERWWEQVGGALPPPLNAQTQAALQQTRLYMQLARGMAPRHDGAGDLPDASLLGPEQILLASFSAWPEVKEPDAHERRCLAAYAAMAEALSRIAIAALERARNRLASGPRPDPETYFDTVCREVERAYRDQAGSDAFSRLVGELVNARVQMFSPTESATGETPGQ